MKRTKVRCPKCGKTKITRSVHFRCCGVQHDTLTNLATSKPKETKPILSEGAPETSEALKEVKDGGVSEDMTNSEATTIPKETKDIPIIKEDKVAETSEDTGITIIYKDTETGETLLTSDGCQVFMGTWDGKDTEETEVTLDVDRGKEIKGTKETSTPNDTSITPASNPTENPGSFMENKWVQAAIVGAIGLGIGMLGKSKNEAGNTIIGKVMGGGKNDKEW